VPGASRAAAQRRKAIAAAAVGSAVEWYDFFLFGAAAALVFPTLFFPEHSPLSALLLAFLTYFVGFLARPIGAAIFGHVGDRHGRKHTLVATLLLMGVSTFAIGLLPPHAAIGAWGGIALVALRLIQGVGVGGEWGGAMLLAFEWAEPGRRGLAASWPQVGVAIGLVLANAALAAASWLSGPAFLTWGWRLPFFFSAVLVGLGIWVRSHVEEPPATDMGATPSEGPSPVLQVLRHQWPEVVLTALARSGQQAPFYIFTAWILSHATLHLGVPREQVLRWVMAGSLLMVVSVPFWAWVSDRVGRHTTLMAGALAMVPFSFVYVGLLESREPLWMILAVVLALPVHDIQYGPQAAYIAERFPPAWRCSGASLGYQLASIVSGGPAPLLAVWLQARTGSAWSIAALMAVAALIGLIAMLGIRWRERVGHRWAEPGHAC
jgi:MFS family permease